jgi:hypothetical protein
MGVTKQRVTAQWSFTVADPDFFATITSLAAHYSHLLQGCMAATDGGSWRLIAREEDDAKLW